MEKLTSRDSNGKVMQITVSSEGRPFHSDEVWSKLAEFEEAGLPPAECAELAKAKAEGRLAIFPIKPYSTVWALSNGKIKERVAKTVETNCKDYVRYEIGTTLSFDAKEIGKTVFLTREEAKAALETQEKKQP